MRAWRTALALLLATMWLGAHLQAPALRSPLPLSGWTLASGAATFALLAAYVARGSAAAGLAASLLVFAGQFALSRSVEDYGKIEGMPAAAVLAYFLAAALSGDRDKAASAARAVIGAAYTVAGLCKLIDGGPGWINGYSLRVFAHAKSLESSGALSTLRLALASSPEAAWSASLATVLVELSGAAMLSPRARVPYAAALLLMHAGMYLGLGIMFWTWAATVALFGFRPEPKR
ncbi:MAG: hypothetical protein HYV14_04575 [Elusimicrobia bacterium]|nr:hypothetical protein [Elusimicrobiota bacterium]